MTMEDSCPFGSQLPLSDVSPWKARELHLVKPMRATVVV